MSNDTIKLPKSSTKNDVIDITPFPADLLKTFSNCNHTKQSAILDLLDNSIDAGASNISLSFIPGGGGVFPSDPSVPPRLVVVDNGIGMSREGIGNCLRAADTRTSNGIGLGKFGIGVLQSVGVLIGISNKPDNSCFNIITKQKNESDVYSFKLNFKTPEYKIIPDKNLDESLDEFNTHILKNDNIPKIGHTTGHYLKSSGTVLCIDLDRSFFENSDFNMKNWLEDLNKQIGMTFEQFMTDKECEFFINKKRVVPLDILERGNEETTYYFPATGKNPDLNKRVFGKKVFLNDKSDTNKFVTVTFVLLGRPKKTGEGKLDAYHAEHPFLNHTNENQGVYIARNGRITYRSNGKCDLFSKIFKKVPHVDTVRIRMLIEYNGEDMDQYFKINNTKNAITEIDVSLLNKLQSELKGPLQLAVAYDKSRNDILDAEKRLRSFVKVTNLSNGLLEKTKLSKKVVLESKTLDSNNSMNFSLKDDKLIVDYNTNHTRSVTSLTWNNKTLGHMVTKDAAMVSSVQEIFEDIIENVDNKEYLLEKMSINNFNKLFNKNLDKMLLKRQRNN